MLQETTKNPDEEMNPLVLMDLAEALTQGLIQEAQEKGLNASELVQVVTLAQRLLCRIQTDRSAAALAVLEADALLRLVSGDFVVQV